MAELANAEADFPTENVKETSSSGLESIYFNTAFCIGCEDTGVIEDGLQVTLLSRDGSGCVTEGLDNPYFRDYRPSNLAIFDSVEDGLADCAGAVLEGGPLGGSVMWTGQVILTLTFHGSTLLILFPPWSGRIRGQETRDLHRAGQWRERGLVVLQHGGQFLRHLPARAAAQLHL